ncbi:MAG TPA: AraC family transcriptional regulator [Solimonas sp.]|nr:AraC family transcriptional regulator [Solimonas sp.]
MASLHILLAVAERYGVDASRCLRNSGIERALLDAPQARIDARQELQVIRNALDVLGPDRPFALEAGSRHHISAFGIWGFALLSSPNFHDAVQLGLRYIRLTAAYCRIEPLLTADEAVLRLDDSDLPEDLRHFLVERDLAALITLQRDLEPHRLPVKALRFRRAAPPYAARFEDLLGVTPLYDQAHDETTVPIELLRIPLPQSNPQTLRASEEECRRLLERHRLRGGLAGQVRDRLTRTPAAIPTMVQIAAELDINPRTLRRRLATEATNYESLVDEVRGVMAEELLSGTDLSIEEIAERLGYSEPSAFSRAFKRWKSVAPLSYRRRLAE